MKRAITILGVVAVLGAGSAFARDRCDAPMAEWQPREAIHRLAQENGWTVRRIKIDDGCYELDGTDREGRRIEVTLDPATLRVIKTEFREPRERPRRDGRERD